MKLLDLIDRVVVVVSVIALLAMMLLTTVSVIGRYFFAAPIPDDLVMSEFLMLPVVFLPLSAVQVARGHVFVTIFTEWMSSRTRMILETFGVVVGLCIFSIIACAAYTEFADAWQVGAYIDGPLELPEAPARFVLFFGISLFALRLLADAVRSIAGLARGRVVAAASEEPQPLDIAPP